MQVNISEELLNQILKPNERNESGEVLEAWELPAPYLQENY